MSVRLYQYPFSPFCIPITRILEAADIEFTSVEIPPWDRSAIIEATRGEYYQVPLLVSDGEVVFESSGDSQDVAQYVDRRFVPGRLFPPSAAGLHEILLRYLEHEVEEISFRISDPDRTFAIPDLVSRTMMIRFKERKFGRGCVDLWARQKSELLAQLVGLLAPVEARLRQSRWLLSNEAPVYADFLLFGLMGNITHGGYTEVPKELSAIRDHIARLATYRF
jgi:glutathione S-transferase